MDRVCLKGAKFTALVTRDGYISRLFMTRGIGFTQCYPMAKEHQNSQWNTNVP